MLWRLIRDGLALVIIVVLTRMMIQGRVGTPTLLLYAVVAAFLAAVALRFPVGAAAVALAAIVAIPIYWAQPIQALRIASTPGNLLPLILLPAAVVASRGRRGRLSSVDWLFGTYVALLVLVYFLNFDGPLVATVNLLAKTVVPYVTFRLLAMVPGFLPAVSLAMAAVAVPLSVIGLQERAGVANPFFTLVTPGYEAGAWAHANARFDVVRAEASFGHPIAFGLFLAMMTVVIVALLWSAQGRARAALVGALILVLFALLATASRGPLGVLFVAITLWLVTLRRDVDPRRLAAVGLAVVALLVFTPAGTLVSELQDSLTGDTREARTVEHRITINRLITDPANFSFLGPENPDANAVRGAAAARTGISTIDSEYSLIFLAHGLVPLLAFTAVGVAVWRVAIRRNLLPLERAWAAGSAGLFFGALGVALITQMATLFWITVAVTAEIGARGRLGKDHRPLEAATR